MKYTKMTNEEFLNEKILKFQSNEVKKIYSTKSIDIQEYIDDLNTKLFEIEKMEKYNEWLKKVNIFRYICRDEGNWDFYSFEYGAIRKPLDEHLKVEKEKIIAEIEKQKEYLSFLKAEKED